MDSVGQKKTQILVLSQGITESRKNFGKVVHEAVLKKMREMRISVV